MAIELKVPQAGESITEVQVGEWLKRVGDPVERDEIVVRIDTDKASMDLPAPVAGRLSKIVIKAGQQANVGDVLGLIEEGAGARPPAGSNDGAAASEKPPAPSESPPPSKRVMESIPPQGFARVMPSARRALKERGLKAEDVEPSGPGGRVLKEDVLRHAEAPESEPRADAERPHADLEERVPMTPFRRRIAERLVQAQQTAALLTTFNEIDMSAVMALRKQHQEAFQARYEIKLGFMSFFVKACIDGLKSTPALNAEIQGREIVYKNHYDIGIAVGGGKGLAVPVLRDADRMSFAEVEKTIADFAKRAQASRLELSELEGGTFTISNGGIYGSLLSTPIVNPPQSGILGLHAIMDRPVAVDGQVVIRPMMYVALTYDHRLVDGREAVTFLRRIKQCVEDPARILVEV